MNVYYAFYWLKTILSEEGTIKIIQPSQV